jgi:RNA polymerase sigma-70 factor (ECF subfamily)
MFTTDLLTGCQRGDAKSQRKLYEISKSMVMGVCRRYTRNKQEAEDVFQETFIRVYKNVRQVKDADHFQAWIRRTAANAAINYYHKHKRHAHVPESEGYAASNEDHGLILSHFTDEQLIGLINDLPDGYRMVFNLYEVEGFTHAEIASLLNISEVTSRTQLLRAKTLLKNELSKLGIRKYEKYA